VVTIMPGSRMSEIKYNTVAFVQAAQAAAGARPLAALRRADGGRAPEAVLPAAGGAGGLQDVEIQLLDGQSHTAIAAADAVMVASGTASLEVALFKKPMVIAYRMMELEWQILRHFGYQPWIGLPNILAREFLVPELLQHAASPKRWPKRCGSS
jgi:lipid-A-disaccharide synthase